MSMYCEMCAAEVRIIKEKRDKALDLALRFGGIDVAYHKAWVIDQMVRELLGSDEAYKQWVKNACNGENGPDTYEWDEGIAP